MQAASDDSSPAARAGDILGQIGLELAFAQPGRDTGLLPVNSLLMDLDELVRPGAPPAVSAALAAARRWLDAILDGPGTFSNEAIRNLNAWHGWMGGALSCWKRGAQLPAVPAEWGGPVAVEPMPAPAKPVPGPASGDAEPVITLNLAGDSELLQEFHAESLELLQTIEQGVLRLEEQPGDAGTINSIFRAFHTFKGGAGFLHLDALRDLAHDLESLLDAVRRSALEAGPGVIELILAGGDALKQFTREIGVRLQANSAGAPIVVATRALRERVKAASGGGPVPRTPHAAAPTPSAAAPAPSAPSTAAVAVNVPQEAPVPGGASVAVSAPGAAGPAGAATPAGAAPAGTARDVQSPPSPEGDASTAFVKLDTRKLDSLVDLVGELVIAQSMVVQDPALQGISSRPLGRALRQLGRITSELQRTAMSLRMVPIRRTFRKMTRLVRDLAAQQQKQVQLVLEGEETELDRNIVEQLSDPLVHMIRNAVDHGIEPPAVRESHGKNPLGTIRLAAGHQGGGIYITISDDGMGLDRDRILATARRRGLIQPEATPTEPETFALIFAPGFSTAEKVTDVSGRGVGMDVVRRNIEKLRGKVEIQSVAGQGSTFTIVLPLTLAIIDGLLLRVGEERYIIPTLSVRESFRPRPGMVSTVHERGEVVSVRGRLTPLLRLGPHLGTPCRAVDPTEGIIVVVESGDAVRGLFVDELLGKQEVVIKALGETFRRQQLFAGAAILGDGRVGLILDVDSLVKCQRTHAPANGDRLP